MMDRDGMRAHAERLLRLQAKALDAAANTIIITDRYGLILWTNEAAEATYGYRREEMVGRTPRIFQSGRHDQVFYADLWQTILAGDPWQGTIENRTKDGALLQEQMTITPVKDEEGHVQHFIAIKQNVTEHKRLETHLHLTRFAMENSSDAIFIAEPDGRLIYTNGAAAQLLNRPTEALHGRHIYRFDGNLDARRWRQRLAELRESHSLSYESRYGADGRRRQRGKVVDVSLSRIAFESAEYICATVRDISERRRTEEALRLMVEGTASTTGRAFFRSAVKHLAEVLGMRHALLTEVVGRRGGRVRTLAAWSAGHFTDLGEYALAQTVCAEVVGRAQSVVYPKKVQELFPRDPLLQQLAANSYEGLPLVGSDGAVIGHLALLDNKPLPEDRGRTSILRIFADRAAAELERQRTLERLREAKERADAANRAKGRFLANMSHELRTPLNGILGYAQVLKRDSALGEKQKEGLRVIERSGEHLLDLINDVLDLSKVEAQKVELQPVLFSLPVFLEEICRSFRLRAVEGGLSFHSTIDGELPETVRGDERRLRQVLFNLLDNAIKFTKEGSVVIAVRPKGEAMEFSVSDTGCGIPRSMVPRLFQPFSQVGQYREQEEKGTGLGLAISKNMVELLGGELRVESQEGKGSRFYFSIELPAVRQALKPISSDCLVLGYEGRRRRLLLLDSDRQRSRVLEELLDPIGVSVQQCRTDEFDPAEEGDQPDAVLVAARRGDEQALSLIRSIRTSPWGAALSIIALTPAGKPLDSASARAAGCDDVILTPYKETDLLKRLGQALELHWVVRDAEGSLPPEHEMEIPPRQELEELQELCMLGDVVAVRTRAETLQADQHYSDFAGRLLELAGQYRMKPLRMFLQGELERGRANDRDGNEKS